ncbi:hypothetical protein GGS24DRAFT_294406 [Hypoxylon argillaceum]|nr:hypothetical protein GGS24DRAFT_294406 [Hypoxylon argillaceum]
MVAWLPSFYCCCIWLIWLIWLVTECDAAGEEGACFPASPSIVTLDNIRAFSFHLIKPLSLGRTCLVQQLEHVVCYNKIFGRDNRMGKGITSDVVTGNSGSILTCPCCIVSTITLCPYARE